MKKTGFSFLSAKALSVLAAAFGGLLHTKAEGQIHPLPETPDTNHISYSEFQERILKPKLTIKLNVDNPDNSLLAFHQSHSSHSSHSSHYSSSSSGHSSHSSHSSHASHYSGSSESYSPSYTPYTPPATTTHPRHHPVTGSSYNVLTGTTGTSDAYTLGSRVLYKGCKGSDVKELQRLLFALHYRLLITGYFGDQTEAAVIKFQKANELPPNGRVDAQTLTAIQNQSNGQ